MPRVYHRWTVCIYIRVFTIARTDQFQNHSPRNKRDDPPKKVVSVTPFGLDGSGPSAVNSRAHELIDGGGGCRSGTSLVLYHTYLFCRLNRLSMEKILGYQQSICVFRSLMADLLSGLFLPPSLPLPSPIWA